jgi:hypothetical protein
MKKPAIITGKTKMVGKTLLTKCFLLLALFICCSDNPTESQQPKQPKSYLPELVLINKNLTFTMGCLDLPGWYYTNLTEKPLLQQY